MVEVNEHGLPIRFIAGPRGRVFPYGYGRPDAEATPTCRTCGGSMVLRIADDFWACPSPDCQSAGDDATADP